MNPHGPRFLLACAALLVAVSAAAQQPTPSVQDIIQKLRPAPNFSTRSLSLRGVTVEQPDAPPKPATPPSIDLSVNFEFGSARLTTDARIVLDNLGRALMDPALKPYHFLIAGHTDAVGRPDFNLRLSDARARSVAEYLEHVRGVAPERLTTKGYGATRLLYQDDPTNALNRRVQITTIVPSS